MSNQLTVQRLKEILQDIPDDYVVQKAASAGGPGWIVKEPLEKDNIVVRHEEKLVQIFGVSLPDPWDD